MNRSSSTALFALFLGTLGAGPALAQSTFATIVGNVQDASGSSVLGASVKVLNINENTLRELKTNDGGTYEALNLKPSIYKITVTKTGFQTFASGELLLTRARPCGSTRLYKWDASRNR